MKRRDVLQGSIAFTTCSLFPAACAVGPNSSIPQSNPTPEHKLIDVHCHVFNGSDLPSVRFLKIVVLKAYPKEAARKVLDIDDPDALDGLISILTWVVGRTRAPKAAKEIAVLDKQERADRRNENSGENEDAVIDAIAAVVAEGGVGVADDDIGFSKIRSAIFAAAGESGVGVSDEEIDAAEARAVAEKAYKSEFDLGVLLRWFALFTRYRYALCDQLASDYRQNKVDPTLLCPALIDYDFWLGQHVTDSPLPDQVTVLGSLSRRKSGAVVHGYVGFDPLRQIAHDMGKANARFNPLELVSRAIRDEGFVGVKLYPPMGFRPIGNAASKCQTYPDLEIVREIAGTQDQSDYSDCNPRPIQGSHIVGQRLDAAMERLYQFCDQAGACIIAHANNSNGSNKDYGRRADPAYWSSVFTRWPNLHITLAHFGSFDTRSAGASKTLPLLEASWEWEVGRYIKLNPRAPVFTDVSYLTEIAALTPEDLGGYAEKVRRWIHDFDPECNHLLYGSDWLMLGADPAYKGYATMVIDFFSKTVRLDDAQMERFLYLNSARFLGLREGDKTRSRLLSFYDKHGVPVSRLPSFDSGRQLAPHTGD